MAAPYRAGVQAIYPVIYFYWHKRLFNQSEIEATRFNPLGRIKPPTITLKSCMDLPRDFLILRGAQWLSGNVLDLIEGSLVLLLSLTGSPSCVLEQATFSPPSTGPTQETSRHGRNIADWDEKHHLKQNSFLSISTWRIRFHFLGCLDDIFRIYSNLDWLQSLKQFFINVSNHILVASLTLMALF